MKPGPLTSHTPPPVHPAMAAGVALLALGCLAWLWTADWRYAATGAVLLFLSAVIAATRK